MSGRTGKARREGSLSGNPPSPDAASPTTRQSYPGLERLATRGLRLLFVLALLALAYAVVRSGRHSSTAGLAHIVAPAIAALLLFLALRLRPHYRIRVALLSFVSLLALLLLDAAIVFLMTPPTLEDLWEEQGIDGDSRRGAEVAVDLRARGEDVYPNVSGLLFRTKPSDLVPIGGISRKRIAFSNETGRWTFFQSDKYGFHNEDRAWDAPSVVLVGDSFCQGVGLARQHNFAGQLNSLGHKTLNLGWSGFGPLLELAAIREYAGSVRPKHVFWMYYEGNDLTDLSTSLGLSEMLRSYLEDATHTQGLIERQDEIDARFETLVKEYVKPYASREDAVSRAVDSRAARILRLYHLRERVRRLFLKQPPFPPQFAEVLKRARDDVRAWGGELTFVYLPEFARYAQSKDESWRHRRRVLKVAADLGLRVIDMHPRFLAQDDPLDLFNFRVNTHYNRVGCGLVASALAKAIERR